VRVNKLQAAEAVTASNSDKPAANNDKKEEAAANDDDEEGAISSDEEDDNDDKLMDTVKNADTANETKHGYRLSLQRFIVFIYSKEGKKKKGDMFKVLHKDLLTDLDVAKGKGSVARLQQVAMAHLLKADPNYLPIDLPNLEPEVFLGFLLSITDSKAKKYHKSYGVHHSALMFLFKFL
jgi:hypothetical protein